MALGAVGLAAATALLIDVSSIAVIGILALVLFHSVLGWKVYNLPTGAYAKTVAAA